MAEPEKKVDKKLQEQPYDTTPHGTKLYNICGMPMAPRRIVVEPTSWFYREERWQVWYCM